MAGQLVACCFSRCLKGQPSRRRVPRSLPVQSPPPTIITIAASLPLLSLLLLAVPFVVSDTRHLQVNQPPTMASIQPSDARVESDDNVQRDVEKSIEPQQYQVAAGPYDSDDQRSDADRMQDGVKRVRAITETWSKSTLASMFVL
jgi:hypothetical protein